MIGSKKERLHGLKRPRLNPLLLVGVAVHLFTNNFIHHVGTNISALRGGLLYEQLAVGAALLVFEDGARAGLALSLAPVLTCNARV